MSEVSLIQTGQAILSLRDSDFDSYSAYGEAIDNAIDAKAKSIYIFTKDDGKKRSKFTEIAFCDDGIGMEGEVLHRCLSLGYSSRYNDRSGIGRFGVGMTLGAVHEAKRVEVYSRKSKNKKWMHTYIDLDEMTGENPALKSIPKPIEKDPPAEFLDYLGKESGTCVVWKKYDRAPHSSEQMLSELNFWIGRTFRYFIWDGIKFFVNKKKINAWDPLFLKPETTDFSEDEPAKAYGCQTLQYGYELDNGKHGTSPIKVSMSLLPISMRRHQGDGGQGPALSRKINENEGISIIRNKREVFFGHIPYWKPAFEEKDRWIGIEVSFDAILDKAFTVKNIKRGAVPTTELKEQLYQLINPTRKECKKIVSQDWAKTTVPGDSTGRPTSNIKTPNAPKGETGVDLERFAISKEVLDRIKESQKINDLVFEEYPFGGAQFLFELQKRGNKTVIVYNSDHEFYKVFKSLKDRVARSEEKASQDLIILFDLIITGYGWAECSFSEKEELGDPNDHFMDMRLEWGKKMRDFANAWHRQAGIKDAE